MAQFVVTPGELAAGLGSCAPAPRLALAAVAALAGACRPIGNRPRTLPALGAELECRPRCRACRPVPTWPASSRSRIRHRARRRHHRRGTVRLRRERLRGRDAGPRQHRSCRTMAIDGCMLDAMRQFPIPRSSPGARQAAGAWTTSIRTTAWRARGYTCSAAPRISWSCRPSWRPRQLTRPRRAATASSRVRMPAGHGFVTTKKGMACGQTGTPYVNQCKYDQAGDMLASHLRRAEAERRSADRRVPPV